MENSSTNQKLLDVLDDQVIGIDHVAIAVVDLEEAIAWYTEKLGFRLTERRTTRGRHTSMLSAVVIAGAAVVVLIQGTTAESQVSRFIENFGAGVQHIALAVKDVDVAMSRVAGAGGKSDTPMIADNGIRQYFLRRDPGSGVRLELIERRGGSFSDTSVEQLFRAFEANDLY